MQVHQALLSILIGKSGAIAQVPGAGPPVAAALRALEAVVDAFAFAIIGVIPDQSSCAQSQTSSLQATLLQSLTAYGVTPISTSLPSLPVSTTVSLSTTVPSSTVSAQCPPPSGTCTAGDISNSALTVVNAINSLTTQSQNLQAPANGLGASLSGIADAGQVAAGLTTIVTAAGNDIISLGALKPFDLQCDEIAIVNALTAVSHLPSRFVGFIMLKAKSIVCESPSGPPQHHHRKSRHNHCNPSGWTTCGGRSALPGIRGGFYCLRNYRFDSWPSFVRTDPDFQPARYTAPIPVILRCVAPQILNTLRLCEPIVQG